MSNSIYRLPAPAGYVGGFQWGVVLLLLVLFVGANQAGTQYMADEFGYVAQLGKPLVCLDKIPYQPCVYQPFAWVKWGIRYQLNKSSSKAVRNVAVKTQALVFALIMVSLVVVMVRQSRRTRRAQRDTEDLHGSARWADKRDIQKMGLLKADHGVYCGGWVDGNRMRYLIHNGQDHVLLFAPSRSGKGVGPIISTLVGSWRESACIYDIKGENWEKSAGYRSTLGPVFRFDPTNPESSSRFNPLAEIRLKTEREVSDAQNIALMLVMQGVNHENPHWHLTAASLLEGLILHACYIADVRGEPACLADVNGWLNRPGMAFRDTLRYIMDYPHIISDGAPHPFIAKRMNEMIEKEDREFAGVHSTAKTAMALFEDPVLAKNTSTSDFRIDDLVNHERPVSLYIVVPPSDILRLKPVVRLLFTVIVARLTQKLNHDGNRWRLLLLIDEFPSLEHMKLFATALSYMAGYGLKAFLIAQDIRQIEASYGNKESIVSNCNVRIAFAPNTQETAQLISNMAGKQTIKLPHHSFSGSRFALMQSNVTSSVQHVERPLLAPDEVMRLRSPEKEGEGTDERIVAPGQVLVFVAGQRPILGTQMLYFIDPVLSVRAAMPPPEILPAIQDGREVQQQPSVWQPKPLMIPAPTDVEEDAQLSLAMEREESGTDDQWAF
jgi:type IV secretion system protein VirD4